VPTHGPKASRPYSVVKDWISDLSPLAAGESDPNDPAHRASRLEDVNLKRIRSTPPGGTRRSWPEELVLPCHRGEHGGHTDVYGRLRWDSPASAMTTRCISLSNGRFGHPEQDRAITPREAACLQTFPREFKFVGTQVSMARQIGNAVPVLLAKTFGEHFKYLCDLS
jgi:DNA (cytosine-5)-methyltransferase 1